MEEVKEDFLFKDFNFHQNLFDGIDAIGFKKATPIQEQAIPVILEKVDLIAVAQTGTGKTAAFLLPIINDICENVQDEGFIHTLIITPTRELATQIDKQVEALAYFTGVTSATVYGGTDAAAFEQQKKALTKGADIIIATPGKLKAHLNFGYVKIGKLRTLILDEADKMLDMGFLEDIEAINKYLPKTSQRLLFSATMPKNIRKLAKSIMNDPKEVSIAISKPAAKIVQCAYLVKEEEKTKLIINLLKGKTSYKSIIIFVSTKLNVKKVAKALLSKKLNAKEIHSDLNQSERENVLREFMNKQFQILVATDIVSRGIDVDDISLVMNYDCPNDAEDYIHRIGRTARGENSGLAITLINFRDMRKFGNIEELIGNPIHKLTLPDGFDSSMVYNPKAKPSYGKKPFKKKFFNKKK